MSLLWGTGEDVSEGKDGGVVRRQLVKGEGYLTPRDGAVCESKAKLLDVQVLC
jgi:hypothetical protein